LLFPSQIQTPSFLASSLAMRSATEQILPPPFTSVHHTRVEGDVGHEPHPAHKQAFPLVRPDVCKRTENMLSSA